MKKGDLFSKFKNYNNELEKILENKQYSEDVKNLLLSMFYKIEAAYKDYEIIKNKEETKREYIQELLNIIDEQCKEIELLNPKNTDYFKEQKYSAIVQKNKIICYPTEKNLLYGLSVMKDKKYNIIEEYSYLKLALRHMLIIGSNIEKKELLRDFNGWSWNIEIDEIENLEYNIIYQNIRLLLGKKFLKEWEVDEDIKKDYILELNQQLNKKYGELLTKEIWDGICKICLLILVNSNEEEKSKLENELIVTKEEVEKITNKFEYLLLLAEKKKEIEKNIRNIDAKVNDIDKIKEEYIKRRKEFKSFKEFINSIKLERKILIDELKKCNDMMDPRKFTKIKDKIENKFEILSIINNTNREEIQQNLIKLQKNIIKALEIRIDNAVNKEEITKIIYDYRYFLFLPIDKRYIKDVSELQQDIKYSQERLINKACKIKVMNTLMKDKDNNAEIIANILNTKLVDLNNIGVQFKAKEEKLTLEIYDGDVLEKNIEYDALSDINIKLNKKIKLFI